MPAFRGPTSWSRSTSRPGASRFPTSRGTAPSPPTSSRSSPASTWRSTGAASATIRSGSRWRNRSGPCSRAPRSWSASRPLASLHAAGALDLGDLGIELLVVLAGCDLDLGALGARQQPDDEAGGVDGRDTHRDLLGHVRLLALQDADVSVRGGAVDGHRLGGLLLLLHVHLAARA